jgi:hypothetical protein
MPGDPTEDDAARRGGVDRIAAPSLVAVVSVDTPTDHVEVVESAGEQLAAALGRIRREVPELPISIRSRTPTGQCRFAFRPSASADSVAEALDHVRDADLGSGVVGWHEDLVEWVRL